MHVSKDHRHADNQPVSKEQARNAARTERGAWKIESYDSCIDLVCETADRGGFGRRANTLRVPRKSPGKRLSIQDDDKIQHDPQRDATGLLMGPC